MLSRPDVDAIVSELKISPGQASIREMVLLVGEIEKRLGVQFLRMEFGIPGLQTHPLAIEAEIGALRRPGVANTYAPISGVPQLKEAGSHFLKAFLDVDIPAKFVIPTVGSMQGGFVSQAVAGRMHAGKDRILFIDPCFSVHRIQCRFLGLKEGSIDLYDRATWLNRVEAALQKGDVGGILYSSPNNPTWVILSDEELRRLGDLCTKYDAVAIEDNAYFGMDFRVDYSRPGEPPYPPTIAKHTDNYIYLLSASKIFSYAGQRAALAFLSPKLCEREFPNLEERSGYRNVYDAFVMSGLYASTSSVPQSPQYGLAALLNRATKGDLNFLQYVAVYAERAKFMRKVCMENGFQLVYAEDLGQPLSDGFFFTLAYPGMTGEELSKELLYYGISATTLVISRSERKEAIRACVSLIDKDHFKVFEERIRAFHKDHAI